MCKRRRETVVPFHNCNLTKVSSKVYRSTLMLYVPWRNEDSGILGGYMTYKAQYGDLSDNVMINEQRYSRNASVIDDAVGHLNRHGPPQHARDQGALNRRTWMPMPRCSSSSKVPHFYSDSLAKQQGVSCHQKSTGQR